VANAAPPPGCCAGDRRKSAGAPFNGCKHSNRTDYDETNPAAIVASRRNTASQAVIDCDFKRSAGWVPQALVAIAVGLGAGLAGCGGSDNSAPPTGPAISVIAAPADQTVIAGQTATFSVTADSSSALSYQWQGNGADIPGATSSAYVTPAADTSADNSLFAVRLSAGTSSVTTTPATLRVFADTAIPAPTEYAVDPAATDNAIDSTQGAHDASINTAVTPRGRLFVFMPGTGGVPLAYRLIAQSAANNGFHAIGLAYENDISVKDLCSGSTDPDCAGKVREERFSGQDVSTLVSVNAANGIQNRLTKAVVYLAQQHPQDGWGQFLDNSGDILWDRVRVSGHSQGGGMAGYIAKQKRVDRVCFFSSPGDVDDVQNKLAAWVLAPGVTPAASHFGFSHQRDGEVPWALVQREWSAFGMDSFGAFVDVDSVAVPFNQSHMLTSNLDKPSWVTDADAQAYHGITVRDALTPLDGNGLLTYRRVWQYQCFL